MSLQDDVAGILSNTGYPYGLGLPPREDIINEAINKVLDAVDRKIDAEGGEFDPSDDLEKGYDDGLAAALKAVKQLRPES